MDWYIDCFREKYFFRFDGRARRREFWMFALCNFLMAVIAEYAGRIIGAGWLGDLYCIVSIPPGMGVSVRRLHDIGKSGWFLLLGLIPVVGSIILLVLYATDGQPDSNAYGENPKD